MGTLNDEKQNKKVGDAEHELVEKASEILAQLFFEFITEKKNEEN